MPLIYLRHPRHGAKIATMDLEAQYDEQNGWERYNPDELGSEAELELDLTPPAQQVNQLPRRGRPRRIAEPNGA
jgi:hypothetical protein